MAEHIHILERLSPIELLMYVEAGGKLVTHRMEISYAAALKELGLKVAPTPEDLALLIEEGIPRRRTKPPRPLVYRPYKAAQTGRPKKKAKAA